MNRHSLTKTRKYNKNVVVSIPLIAMWNWMESNTSKDTTAATADVVFVLLRRVRMIDNAGRSISSLKNSFVITYVLAFLLSVPAWLQSRDEYHLSYESGKAMTF